MTHLEQPSTDVREFLSDMTAFIESGALTLCSQGIGGTYFVSDDEGNHLGVFKPSDEEPGAILNPKNLILSPLLPAGGGAIREVAAYLLDRGFAGVPETYLITVRGGSAEKTGSLQRFIQNHGDSTAMSYSRFKVEDIQRIGILDIRLFNMDRNGENLLVRKNQGDQEHDYNLIPIDHSYILPDTLDRAFFEWMYWPQAKEEFRSEVVDFIHSIDINAEMILLALLGFNWKAIQTLYVSTILLKRCVEKGYTLREIALLLCRDVTEKEQSQLERLVECAKATCGKQKGKKFRSTYRRIVTDYLNQKEI